MIESEKEIICCRRVSESQVCPFPAELSVSLARPSCAKLFQTLRVRKTYLAFGRASRIRIVSGSKLLRRTDRSEIATLAVTSTKKSLMRRVLAYALLVCSRVARPCFLESTGELKLAETRTAIPENRGFLSHDCYLHVLFIDCLVSRQPATYVVGPKARLAVIAIERKGVTECTLSSLARPCIREIKFHKGLDLNVQTAKREKRSRARARTSQNPR